MVLEHPSYEVDSGKFDEVRKIEDVFYVNGKRVFLMQESEVRRFPFLGPSTIFERPAIDTVFKEIFCNRKEESTELWNGFRVLHLINLDKGREEQASDGESDKHVLSYKMCRYEFDKD